jgi:hypothetical protein
MLKAALVELARTFEIIRGNYSLVVNIWSILLVTIIIITGDHLEQDIDVRLIFLLIHGSFSAS